MPVYSVDYIMSMKDKFPERPYPNFSLDYIVSRKQKSERLVRSEAAWVSRSATSTDESVNKHVQGALNKLTPEKYKEILGSLKDPILLEPTSILLFVKAVFAKALAEPAYSEMYARLCFDMAKFELATIASSPESAMLSPTTDTPGSRRSQFRDTIVQHAQQQFQTQFQMPIATGLSPEEEEEAKSAFAKRKKANIKFVGQLFIQGVLSQRIMITVMTSIVKLTGEGAQAPVFYPEPIDIEVLCELLETVGRSMDQPNSDGRAFLNALFQRLQCYLEKNPKYTPRIHFKIMDTVDLRDNKWAALIGNTASSLKPMTMQAAQQDLKKKHATMRSPSSTVTPKSRGSQMRFPETPPTPSGSSSGPTTPSSSSPNPSPQHGRPSNTPTLPFSAKVTELLNEWCEEHNPLRQWLQRFKQYGHNDDDVRDRVIAQILQDACTTTRKEAQRDAADFLVHGLAVPSSELLPGFSKCLAKAIEDDMIEDTPRYYDRFTAVLSGTTKTLSDLHNNMCSVIYSALPKLAMAAEGDSETLEAFEDQLHTVWSGVPAGQVDEGVCNTIINIRGTSSLGERVAAMMLKHLCVDAKLCSCSVVADWAKGPQGAAATSFVELLEASGVLSA